MSVYIDVLKTCTYQEIDQSVLGILNISQNYGKFRESILNIIHDISKKKIINLIASGYLKNYAT